MNDIELKNLFFRVINDKISSLNTTQSQVAELLGIKQSAVSRLKSCQVDTFSVNKLIDYAVLLGVEVSIKIGKKTIKLNNPATHSTALASLKART